MRTVIFLSTLILPTSLFAATLSSPVAEFRAEASLSLSVSAVFAATGEDASRFLTIDSPAALTDSGEDSFGNGSTDSGIVVGMQAQLSASVSGSASKENQRSHASTGVFQEPYYQYNCDDIACTVGDIIVSIDFATHQSSFSAANEILGGTAQADAGASILITACPNDPQRTLRCDGPVTTLRSRGGSGTFQTQVSPYGWVAVLGFAFASGEARYEEPSVVPLPASATSLLAAFGLLGAAQMRNRRHRRQGLS